MTKIFKSDILTCFLFFSFAFPQTELGADIDGEAAADYSGYSVSMSSDGSRLAIGAVNNNANGNASGHVRVYLTNPGQVTFQPQNLDEFHRNEMISRGMRGSA